MYSVITSAIGRKNGASGGPLGTSSPLSERAKRLERGAFPTPVIGDALLKEGRRRVNPDARVGNQGVEASAFMVIAEVISVFCRIDPAPVVR